MRVLLVLLLVAAPAQAWAESEASNLRDDVVAVGHEPAVVMPGEQFRGWLQLAPESNVTHAYYQVCLIGDIACIIPPRPATLDDGRWAFSTADFNVDGPVQWEPNARIGIQWFLGTEAGLENAQPFPHGTPLDDPSCGPGLERAVACYETHYFEFQIAPEQESPGFALPMALLALAAVLRRR